ncbi:MAG: AbrB/MazE/SpoVT family DNA-binding domain-containing protein [Dehalococcoidia bacterium]|nr:AbrB/MazE/SpoVT family DNA-binding domain-containing protein [Dehalococcoidia bacterium]
MAETRTRSKSRSRVKVDRHGRIVIPAEIREQLGMHPGEALSLRVEDGQLRIMTIREAIRQVQEMVRKHTGGKPGLLDEFLADRRSDSGD